MDIFYLEVTLTPVGTLVLSEPPDFYAVSAEACLAGPALHGVLEDHKAYGAEKVLVDFFALLEDGQLYFNAHDFPCR